MKSDVVFALENAAWPALLVNAAGTIVGANVAAIKLFGSVLEGETPLFSSIWPPENGATADQFMAQWEKAPTASAALKFRVKGGATQSFTVSVCSFSREGQKQFIFQLPPEAAPGAESGLAHKQKLDCALQLARTVALDFNNALTSILGHTSLLLGKMEPNHPWRTSLIEVEKSASKAAEIACDLGAFSRQEKEPRTQSAGNLNSLLQRTVELFQSSSGARIAWELRFERRLFAARFDEAKMQQALMKIIENAVQALPAEGRITVQSRNLELTEPTQDLAVRLAPGTYVCAEITDNGAGIPLEVLPRIFEPFFTTKDPARHRGLGLAWVYGIVTNHGGGVAVASRGGTGTSVRVYLPAEHRVVRQGAIAGDDLTGTQTILVVDDEDLLLTMSQTVLSSFGYRVLTANSGAKALELLLQSPGTVDLVITDLVMPAMSGRELLERIRRIESATRVICTSGYVKPSNLDDETPYLQKPFTSQELLLKVKHSLAPGESTLVD
jgi:two-component system, cell cycle sensor histidine kinase and response regulator CckA